jgi:alkylation response protein AidB-like acyl-CoA dehydrogenase
MITKKTLQLSLKSLRDFAKKRLPDEELIALDEKDECPVEIVRHMSHPDKLGIQLLFIPEEYGGMGGSTMDVYLICEQMARIDLGVATSLFATFLGSDPITFGATEEQKKKWLGKIAEEGILFAYGATEPDAGSDLGSLKTTADRVEENGKIVGYKINGSKQWISNGGIAEHYTILANTPAGPSWFVVDAGTKGFTHDKPENKHGIRLRRPGPHPGAEGLRLHARDGRRLWPRCRLVRGRSRHSLLDQAHSGRHAAVGEARLHPQTDRATRGEARSRAGLYRRDGAAHRHR